MKRTLVIGIALLGTFGMIFVFYKGFGTDPHAVPVMNIGTKAPMFKIKRLDTGEVIDMQALLGKPVVLNFWATWCGPCKLEHPVLNWAAKNYPDVTFLGVVVESEEEATRKWLLEHGEGFPQLYDPKSTVAVDYGITGVPETYFIDKAGTIKSKYANPIDMNTMVARLAEIR
jgi:cytochrome c biogenesis protein CcmG/thiol:disulfide interchange protein DsbE